MTILNRLQKVVASVSVMALMLISAAPANAAVTRVADFTDASSIASWSAEAIQELMDQGVLSGNDDGSFAPNRQLNRAEVAKIIVEAAGLEIDTTGGPHFDDVSSSAWYYDYIETMYNYGFVSGYPDGLFRPGVGINRAEIAKMVVNAFEISEDTSGAPHFSDVASSDWFFGFVETVYNNNIMTGYADGSFGPEGAITRQETAVIVYNAQWVGLGSGNNSGLSEGTLEISLSSDTPRGTNIPFNATSVPFTTVELTASDDSDVEISAMTWTRLGLGDNDDFENVWLEIDGFKVGNDKSVNNDDVVELRFNPAVVVPAGQTLLADLVASSKYSSNDKNIGHINRFVLVSSDDIASSAANIVGDFAIEGAEMEVADYEVSELEFTELGSDSTINVGDQFIEVGKFRLLNESTTNKDVALRAMTFKNDGTATLADVVENVALYVSGERVSSEEIIDGDYITFRLDNGVTGGYILEDGDSKIFSIRADVVSAEQGDTINFKIDDFEDVVAVEIGTSFGIRSLAPNGEDAEDDNARLATYTLDSGDLNVSRDPSSLGNQQYSAGSNDVVAMTARVVTDQPLLVDGVKLRVADGSTVADKNGNSTANELADFEAAFDNFRLFLNDQLVDSTNDLELRASGTDGTVTDYRLDFNTTFEISGTSVFKLVLNVEDAAVTGDQIRFELFGTDFDSPEYISTGDNVPADQLLGSATSSFVEVEESVVTVTRTDGFSTETIVAGVDDVEAMVFVLDNNDSGDVNVTSVSMQATGTGAAAVYTNFVAEIFVDGIRQGSSRNLESNGSVTFNDLSVVIPTAGQKEFTLVLDTIESSASGTAATTTVVNPNAGQALTQAVGVGQNFICINGAAPTGTVAVSADGTIFGNNAEVLTVAAGAANGTCTTGTQVVFSGSVFADSHAVTEKWTNTSFTYPIGTTQITVADASRFAANQQININGQAGLTGNPYTIQSISGNVVTLTAATTGSAIASTGSVSITPVNATDTITFKVEDIDVDNIENGQEVKVLEGGADLAVANPLLGGTLNLIKAGTLSVSSATTIYSDILVAGQQDVEVLQVKFQAADDAVAVEEINFANDLDNNLATMTADELKAQSRMTFKLYNGAGQFLLEETMQEGKLAFDLTNANKLLVPKDGTINASIKVSVKNNINDAADTGAQLRLRLDDKVLTGDTAYGVKASTQATGSNLVAADNAQGSSNPAGSALVAGPGYGFVTGQSFVAYKSEINIAHDTDGVWSKGPNANFQNAYQFKVTADAASQAEVSRVTLELALGGIQFGTAAAGADAVDANFEIYAVNSNGTVDDTAEVGDVTVTAVSAPANSGTGATLQINFTNEQLNAGESRSYMLRMNTTANPTGGDSDDDSLSVQILRDGAYLAPSNLAGQAASLIIWSDESANLGGGNDYLNGYLLEIDSNSSLQQD